MAKVWQEPSLDDLLSDPILESLLTRDGVSREDLHRVVQRARADLIRVPRDWQNAGEG